MGTTFHTDKTYYEILKRCAREVGRERGIRPARFVEKMKRSCEAAGMVPPMGPDSTEWKNPVMVALGDSVTAGYFETMAADVRDSYVEILRGMLIDRYAPAFVNVINSGIAGDTMVGMLARAQRDVIRYEPDLVLINGALNWGRELGTEEDFKHCLTELVKKIRENTDADIILLTPNGALPNPMTGNRETGTKERAQVIRKVAAEQQICLCDIHRVWEQARREGCPWEELLANGINHPSVEGHEIYASMLMKLMD